MNAPMLRPSNFHYAPMFPLGPDATPFRKLEIEGVSSFVCDGRSVLKVSTAALSELGVPGVPRRLPPAAPGAPRVFAAHPWMTPRRPGTTASWRSTC